MEQEKLVVKDSTVDKAISKGLAQLNLESHEVDISIISEGKKGLFGFGQKEAVIEIKPKFTTDFDEPANVQLFENEERVEDVVEDYEEDVEEDGTLEELEEDFDDSLSEEAAEQSFSRDASIASIVSYLTDTINAYGAPGTVTAEDKKQTITFHIDSSKPGLIIGKHGKIVNALQTLAQTLYQQKERRRVSIIVNVGDYRERRASILENIADRTAERVLRTKQPVFLEPLPAFERKQIHARLSQNDRIKTHSEGKEPHRYLVVEIAD